MAKTAGLDQFIDKLDDVSFASAEAAKEGLEEVIRLIPASAWDADGQVADTLRDILRGARAKLSEPGFTMLTTWIFTYVASKLSGDSRLGSGLRLLATGGDELLRDFMEGGPVPVGTDSADSKAPKSASKITGPVWCDGRTVHHTRHHAVGGKAESGGEENHELMGGYVRGDKHFCTECFTPDQIAGFYAKAWTAAAPASDKPAPTPPSTIIGSWGTTAQAVWRILATEANREVMEGDFQRLPVELARPLRKALLKALNWPKDTADRVFTYPEGKTDTAVKTELDKRECNVGELFHVQISELIMLIAADGAAADKVVDAAVKKGGGALVGIIGALKDAFSLSDETADALSGTLDRLWVNVPERERQSFAALVAKHAGTAARSASVYGLGAITAGVILLLISWIFIPAMIFTWGSTLVAITVMTLTIGIMYSVGPALIGYAYTRTVEVEPEKNAMKGAIEEDDEGVKRYRTTRDREASANYSAGANALHAATLAAAGAAFTVYAAPLLAGVTALIYSGVTVGTGFHWFPGYAVVIFSALWYIPFLTIDMGLASVSTVANTLLSWLPNSTVKEAAVERLKADLMNNVWKDVGLKAVNGLQVLQLLIVLVMWPIYPFATIPLLVLTFTPYLVVMSWYGLTMLSMRRDKNTTNPDVGDILKDANRRYVGMFLRVFTWSLGGTLVAGVLLTALNGGAQLQRPDKLGPNGTNRPENLLTIFADLGTAAKQQASAQAKVVQQASATELAKRQRCNDLKVALQHDAGFCGRPAAVNYPDFCNVSQNPNCRSEILRSVAAAKAQK